MPNDPSKLKSVSTEVAKEYAVHVIGEGELMYFTEKALILKKPIQRPFIDTMGNPKFLRITNANGVVNFYVDDTKL